MSDIYYVVAHRDQEEIDSFKSRYQKFDPSCITTLFKQALNLEVVGFTPSTSWGSSHIIYFVTIKGRKSPLVFRANLGFNKKPEVVMKTEQLICEMVAKTGVPTNKVLYVDVSRTLYPFDFQIQECLEGSDIENNFRGTKEEYDQMSFQLGVYIARYSKLTFTGFGMFDEDAVKKGILKGTKTTFYDYITTCLDSDLEYLVTGEVISFAVSNEIKHLFEVHRQLINSVKVGSLVHHDLADHNIFFKESTITGVFDWETAVAGDPILDLASCPTWKTFYPREDILVAGYKSITPLPEFFQEKMHIYRLRTMLWKMVYAIRMNIVTDTRKQKFYSALQPFKLL